MLIIENIKHFLVLGVGIWRDRSQLIRSCACAILPNKVKIFIGSLLSEIHNDFHFDNVGKPTQGHNSSLFKIDK